MDDNIAFNDIVYARTDNGTYITVPTDEFKSYLTDVKQMLDDKPYNAEYAVEEVPADIDKESKIQQAVDEVKFSISNDTITRDDVKAIQSVGRKSVNNFTSEDIEKTKVFAERYFKELGVKSPFFRAWFGDWRANDTTPIKVATKRKSSRGITKNNDTGWDIQVSGKVFNETKSHNQNYNVKARPYLEYINSIVENAVLLDSFSMGNKKSENSATVMLMN